MTRTFGLDAASALEALQTAVKRLGGDGLNEDLARGCAVKAWHLCDHVWQALGPKSSFASLRKIRDHAKSSCPELAYLQDICTESKHAVITRYEPRINAARHHIGDFSREDFSSEDFDTSRLEIELRDGHTVPFEDVIRRAVDFWADFFKRHGIE